MYEVRTDGTHKVLCIYADGTPDIVVIDVKGRTLGRMHDPHEDVSMEELKKRYPVVLTEEVVIRDVMWKGMP